MTVDWLNATNEQRKTLYEVAQGVAVALNLPIETLLNRATGQNPDVEWGDLANLRKGRLARPKSKALYLYMAEHHYDLAQRENADLFPYQVVRDIPAYIRENAISDRLHIVPVEGGLGISARRSQRLSVDAELRLGQNYILELDAEKDGFAVAFQGYKDQWHAIPLGLDGTTQACRIQEGVQQLPRLETGEIDLLSEEEDAGTHSFLVLTSSNRMHLENQGRLPERLDRLDIYFTRVRFSSNLPDPAKTG